MSSSTTFAQIFLAALLLSTLLRLWLGKRQIRHVTAHRGAVPSQFATRIELPAHQKAADYSVAKTRLSLLEILLGTGMATLFTFGGLLDQCIHLTQALLPGAPSFQDLALFGLCGLIGYLGDLPFALYRTFILEARFGFNKTTPGLFIADLLKQLLLAVLIGSPLLLCVFWLMSQPHWWLWVWLAWMGFNLLVLLLYPTFIAPLFNKFTPLDDSALKERIEALLGRCGFRANGLFVMDGSRRSAHGNAYFTGFGAAKRIVFFDTLLAHLQPQEIEAVLAHELGHFQHRHLWKRLCLMAMMGLAFLWGFSQLMVQDWFFAGLGVSQPGNAAGLILFSLVLPAFTFPLSPLLSALSRRHEYEADAYAAAHSNADHLTSALVKLYRDNASTLTPDPMHSLFYDSHPSANMRIGRLSHTP